MPRHHRWVLFGTGVVLTVNLLFGLHVYSGITEATGEDRGFLAMRQFAGVLKLIRRSYVDEDKVDYQELIYGALRGMLGSLDRFSSFIPPKDFVKMREETEGEFGGIGVVVSIKDDALTVIAPMEGTPGMHAGLRPNDRIVRVDGADTVHVSLAEAVNMIKGQPGTEVELTIYRPSTKKTFPVTVERAVIEIETVKDAKLLPDGVGYVRVTQFSEKTADKLLEAVFDLRVQGMRGLILDLRNNPGGLLTSAVDVCSMFLPPRYLIVFTEGRNKSQRQDFLSLPGKKFLDFPIIILINEGSASAAEIVSGCLRDNRRAMLVGEKSFGKGSVQSIIELPDGSAVRLTTAHYYTPSKRVIHNKGIEPDVVIDISDHDAAQLYLQRSRLPGTAPDEHQEPDIPDRQLTEAVRLMTAQLTGHSFQPLAEQPPAPKKDKAETVPAPVGSAL